MNNIVQYRAATCSPQFMVIYQGWQYVDSGSTLKYHIKGNFCLQTSIGAKWGGAISGFDCILLRICSGKL